MKQNYGFTLVEVLVVTSIIGILAGVVLSNLNDSRGKAMDAIRQQSLREMESALELYYLDNGQYPSTAGVWRGISDNGGNRSTTGATGYIPDLAPKYMDELPIDPLRQTSGWSGYLYRSIDGTNYKLLSHAIGPHTFPTLGKPFYDPVRPTTALMICSGGTECNE